MEFDFDLNKVLPNTITFVDYKRSPFRNHVQDIKLLRKQLDKVIDSLGSASSKAQGLATVITSAAKLQHSDHELYILKDAAANSSHGAAVGMIKVGRKTLFLLDTHGIQNEVVPLCVMDFYVHYSCQRTGCGKKLFEHMLKIHSLQPSQVAIDRPSYKFLSFLKKHYGLHNSLSQPNKFLVFDQFFKDLNAIGYVPRKSQRMRSTSGNTFNRPPVHPYRRNSAHPDQQSSSHPPQSRKLSSRRSSRKEQFMDVDDDEINNEVTKAVLPPITRRLSRELSAGRVRSTDTAGSRESSANSTRGLAAQASLYSRHGSAGMRSTSSSKPVQTWNRNAVSASAKSLHASSQDNPLAIGFTFVHKSPNSSENTFPQSSHRKLNTLQQNARTTAARSASTSTTGNYTLTSVLNAQNTSRGSSWNVFGIPPVDTDPKTSYQTKKHGGTFPF